MKLKVILRLMVIVMETRLVKLMHLVTNLVIGMVKLMVKLRVIY